MPNRGDMTQFKDWPDAAFDVLVGGTPCQSFSVAGLRAGLDDPRGNLMLIFGAVAARYRPRWLVWENVPGVLSSNRGRDFGSFLGLLGLVGYGFAYRVLDAQFVRVDGYGRAVPQRRNRVFVVGHLGDWRPAAAVLLERESLRGDPAPRRQAGQGAAARALRSSDGGIDREDGHTLITEVVGALQANTGPRGHGFGDFLSNQAVNAGHLVAYGGNNTSGPIQVATAVRAKGGTGHGDFESETFVAHALRGEGFDASEDGTGRGTPLVTVYDTTQITHRENCSNPKPGDACHPLAAGAHPPLIAFSCKYFGGDAQTDHTPTLRAMGNAGSNANGGGQIAVAYTSDGEVADPLSANEQRTYTNEGTTFRLRNCIDHGGARVRRLTPVECARLQGFPDDYLDITYRGKPAADGPKYKALGNSMAVNCMRWIGMRIAMAETILEGRLA